MGLARLEALAEGENVFGLRLERFGASVAPAAPRAPELDFVNRIELDPADAGRLDEILAYYRRLGLRPWLEPSPLVGLTLPEGTELLGYQAVVCATAGTAAGEGPPVRETDDADAVARLLLEAFDVPADVVATNAPAVARPR